jgi:hypothetical protein
MDRLSLGHFGDKPARRARIPLPFDEVLAGYFPAIWTFSNRM